MVTAAPLTEDEAAKVKLLGVRVGLLPDDMLVAGSQAAALRRFLVAKKWDVDAAAAQLGATIAWRATHVPPALASPPTERLALVRKLFPSNPLLGISKSGHPVSLACLCVSDPGVVAKEITASDLVSDFVVRAEWYSSVVFQDASAKAGSVIDKEVALVDISGLGLSHRPLLSLFKEFNATSGAFFPERTAHIVVLNAPRAFSVLWSLAKVFVDPRTARKVAICSDGAAQLAALSEHLHEADIPARYGGVRIEPALGGSSDDETRAVFAQMDEWLASRAHQKPTGGVGGGDAARAGDT